MERRNSLSYLLALAGANLRTGLRPPGLALLSALFMLGNNLIFFAIWAIYFRSFSSLKGWVLEDMALLIGICAWAFGLTVVVTGGVRDLAQAVADGRLDVHLGRPRHPLPSLLMSRSLPSGLGDLASSILFWLALGGCGIEDLPLLILLATAAGVVLAATATIIQCVAFWLPGAVTLSEDLFNSFLMIAFYPQHPFSFPVRVLLLTLIPAGFIAALPVEALRDSDPLKPAALLIAAVVYATIAAAVFERGLKRYASGNRILELR